MSHLLENTRQALPGETVRYVFTGEKGLRPTYGWIAFGLLRLPLLVANRARMIAVTDEAIVVMSAGQLRWQRSTPKQVLYRLPRQTRLGPVSERAWTQLKLGSERIWVGRAAYSVIEKADGELSAAS